MVITSTLPVGRSRNGRVSIRTVPCRIVSRPTRACMSVKASCKGCALKVGWGWGGVVTSMELREASGKFSISRIKLVDINVIITGFGGDSLGWPQKSSPFRLM